MGNLLETRMALPVKIVLSALCALSLAGCGSAQKDMADDKAQIEYDTVQMPEKEEGEKETAEKEDIGQGEKEAAEKEDIGKEDIGQEEKAAITCRVKNPGWEYYFAGEETDDVKEHCALHLFSEEKLPQEAEEWARAKDFWFAENEVEKPQFPYSDETYRYELTDGLFLQLSDAVTGKVRAALDFSEFQYADIYKEEDFPYVDQHIFYAKAENEILYAAAAHNTYAASSPHTGYIMAIDLNDGHVVWKSEPLMNNAYSFVVAENEIICGYGFTKEEDFLNVLDKRTGKLVSRVPLDTKPDYIIEKDDILYVQTYNENYKFEITRENDAEPEESAVEAGEKEESAFMKNYDGGYEKEAKLEGTSIWYRMVVVDAALGSRLYGLIKSRDDGKTWEEVSLDPFHSQLGMAVDFTFLDEQTGFAVLAHNGGDSAELYITEDGGNHYEPVAIEEKLFALPDGTMFAPYDYPQMPYESGGKLLLLCGQGSDGDYNGGDQEAVAQYRSTDGGHTFTFQGLKKE